MKKVRILSALLLGLLLTGCADLEGVRTFASKSATLSAYSELTTRFRDTYDRESPYLSGEADQLARENDRKRKTAYEDLLKIHRTASLYMQTLAKLAGEKTFDLSKQVGSLANGIKAYPDLGIDRKHVNALSDISKVITKWIGAAYQVRAVRDMVREGDPYLQTVLDGMADLVRYYRKTNENERSTVLGFFEVEILYANTPKDKLLAVLAREHAQSKATEYMNAQRKYEEAEKGIRSIANGHKQLSESIDKLSGKEIEAMVTGFAEEIETVLVNLQALKD